MHFSQLSRNRPKVIARRIIVASILSDANDPSTVITSLPKDMFRIPVHNQDSGEQDLVIGILDKGILTVEAPMDKAGFWEINEQLINSKLPENFRLSLTKTVFAVVNAPADLANRI